MGTASLRTRTVTATIFGDGLQGARSERAGQPLEQA